MFIVTCINQGYLESTWVFDTYNEAVDAVNTMLREDGTYGYWVDNHFYDDEGLDIYVNEPDLDYRKKEED